MKPAPLAVLAGLLLALAPGVAQGQPASIPADEVVDGPIEDEPPFIDLYTFGVGDRIFEKFGHAALCLRYHDPINPAVCFNYGVTDFADGGAMVWHFLRTEQRCWA